MRLTIRDRGEDFPVVDPARAEHARVVREARLEVAWKQSNWVEIPEARLVQRGRFLVDAETDLMYVHRRGVAFEPGKAAIGYLPTGAAMTTPLSRTARSWFLEHPGGPKTWSEIVARRASRGAAA